MELTSSRTWPELGDLPSILWQSGTKIGDPLLSIPGPGNPWSCHWYGKKSQVFFFSGAMSAAGSFLPTALEQFGGLRPQRLAGPLNVKFTGHGHVAAGRGVGLRSGLVERLGRRKV